MIAGQRTRHRVFTLVFAMQVGDGDCRNRRERRGDEGKKCTAY